MCPFCLPAAPRPHQNANKISQAIGGTIWHGIKGFRNSPYGERRVGAITAIKMRAPVLGGNFGVWGGLFSTFDCAVKGIRKKEDPWNSIIAGFFTGGALAVRGGPKQIRNGAIGCAVLLAVIEGVGMGFQKMMAGSTKLEVSDDGGPSLSCGCANMRFSASPTTGREAAGISSNIPSLLGTPESSARTRKMVDPSTSLNSCPRPRQHGWGVYFLYAFMTVSIKGGGVPCNIDPGCFPLPTVGVGKGHAVCPSEVSVPIISLKSGSLLIFPSSWANLPRLWTSLTR